MTISVDELKSPKGEFRVSMFEEFEGNVTRFDAFLQDLLDQAEVEATAVGLTSGTTPFDRAVKAWATWKGLDDIYTEMLSTAASVDVKDKLQGGFLAVQFTEFGKKVAKYLADFQAEVDLLSTEPDNRLPETGHVPHRFSWGR